jgi:PST family polysaccharide transporter
MQLLRLGLPPALTSVLLLAIINVDSIVVSRVLGVGALGFYVLAFNMANWPLTLLSMPIRQVSLPAFSQLNGDAVAVEEAFSKSLSLVAGVALLGGVLLAALAEPLVGILYSSKWLPTVAALRWLALFGALRVMLELSYDLLIAMGRATALIRLQIGWFAALAAALPVGAHLGGITGVAVSQVVVAAVLVLPIHILLIIRSDIGLGRLRRSLQPVAVAGVTGAAVALLVLRMDTPQGVTLCIGGTLISLAYSVAFLANTSGREALRWANPPFLSRLASTRSHPQAAASQRGPAPASASR